MPIIHIESLNDPRLDDYRNVPDHELLAARGVFIAEGRLVVRRLLESARFATRSLLLTPTASEGFADVGSRFPALPVYIVEPQAMNALAGFNIHRGCLAAGAREPAAGWRSVAAAARTIVVLERVGNADNVGGIFRNAMAFGADGVLLGPACADPLYRKAIRTSMGSALQIPFASMDDWPADLEQLRQSGFTLVALTPAGDVTLGPEMSGRVALMLGHEGSGLSEEALRAADIRARIPMAAGDSLNVATAAAIGLYELRRGQGEGDRPQGTGLS